MSPGLRVCRPGRERKGQKTGVSIPVSGAEGEGEGEGEGRVLTVSSNLNEKGDPTVADAAGTSIVWWPVLRASKAGEFG